MGKEQWNLFDKTVYSTTLIKSKQRNCDILGASEVSANLYCNSRASVLGRLRDYLWLLIGRTLC